MASVKYNYDVVITPACTTSVITGNVALRKFTAHSASYNGIPSGLAVDGDENRCSHTITIGSGRAWWYVDLGYNHVINTAKLTLNIDGNGEYIYGIRDMPPTKIQSELEK